MSVRKQRAAGICPEKGQAFGPLAKHAASEFIFWKEVILQTHGQEVPVDARGRVLIDG